MADGDFFLFSSLHSICRISPSCCPCLRSFVSLLHFAERGVLGMAACIVGLLWGDRCLEMPWGVGREIRDGVLATTSSFFLFTVGGWGVQLDGQHGASTQRSSSLIFEMVDKFECELHISSLFTLYSS